MKIVILDGMKTNDDGKKLCEIMYSELKEDKNIIITHSLRLKKIASCRGCFGCWIKTPGECIVKDESVEVRKDIVNADVVIYLTPIIFGGYSYELKLMLDKIIPNVLPFFKKIKGEIHHKERYRKKSSLIGIGVYDEINEKNQGLFKELVYRNGINGQSEKIETVTVSANADIQYVKGKIREVFNKGGI